jgi:hypothetical protein
MDNRRTPVSSDPPRYVSEVGTDTVPVSLVELTSVNRPKSGRGSYAAGALLVGFVGFILGVAVASPATPSPSPAPFARATASNGESADPSVAAPTSPAATPRPTPRPTSPPPWAWTRSDLLPDQPISLLSMWGVGDDILALAQAQTVGNEPAWAIARLEPGWDWVLATPPRVIDGVSAGLVSDERLWLFARVGGLTPDDAAWHLVSTRDGERYEALDAASGLGQIDGVTLLAKAGRTWLVQTFAYNGDAGEGAVVIRFLRSTNGVQWEDVVIPDLETDLWDVRAASLGDRLVLSATVGDPSNPVHEILTSVDGRTWRRAIEPETLDTASDLACNDQTCVLTGFEFSAPSVPVAWVSSDGTHWTESQTKTDTTSVPLERLIVTDEGFLAVSGRPTSAWTSGPDGQAWERREVIAGDDDLQIIGLAAAGDTVIATTERLGTEPYGVWRGSLSLLSPQ